MSREMIFYMEGRVITIERLDEETDVSFAERSSFILSFRNYPERYAQAKKYSWCHVQKMFRGVTYKPEIEVVLRELRELHLQLRKETPQPA